MSENELDPAASTQQFRAFAHRGQAEPAKTSGMDIGLMVGVGIAIIVLVVVVVSIAML